MVLTQETLPEAAGALPPVEPEQPRLVVFYNPNSTNAREHWEETKQRLGRLASRAGYLLETVETKQDPEEDREQVYSSVRKGDVIGAASGDGYLNRLAEALQRDDAPQHVAEAPILAVPMGNKSDLANTFNRFGWWNLLGLGWRRIAKALKERRTVPMYPMVAEFKPDAKPEGSAEGLPASFKKLVVYVLAFGLTGRGADTINSPAWRKEHQQPASKALGPIARIPAVTQAIRLWREVKMVSTLIRESKPIQVGEGSDAYPDSQQAPSPYIDYSIFNGPRAAGSMHNMIQPYTKEILISKTRGLVGAAVNLLARVSHLGFGIWHNGSHTLNLAQDTPMTFDGEAFNAPAGQVKVTHAEKALNFITSKRKYWDRRE